VEASIHHAIKARRCNKEDRENQTTVIMVYLQTANRRTADTIRVYSSLGIGIKAHRQAGIIGLVVTAAGRIIETKDQAAGNHDQVNEVHRLAIHRSLRQERILLPAHLHQEMTAAVVVEVGKAADQADQIDDDKNNGVQ